MTATMPQAGDFLTIAGAAFAAVWYLRGKLVRIDARLERLEAAFRSRGRAASE